jgi:hypothetical protein
MPLRQPSRHWGEDGNLGISDENLNYEWYRVVYNGWQFILVDFTEKPNYTDCSAYYPVYLKGENNQTFNKHEVNHSVSINI